MFNLLSASGGGSGLLAVTWWDCSSTNLLFAASSLSKLQVRDACVFAFVIVAVSRHHDLTTQQAEFMLPQLPDIGCSLVGLPVCLCRGLDNHDGIQI